MNFKKIYILFVLFLIGNVAINAQNEKSSLRIYGFAMTDAGYNANQIDPDWFDVVRPTKLPAFENEFGTDGNAYFSVRQSRFGVEGNYTTPLGELKTIFEFELFGVGSDAGQTTFRLRHAYGELGQIGAGQYWSPFMDADVFPNSLEYWGPSGMVFFRNIQVRWMPLKGETRLTFALERPGASGDGGIYANRIELQGIEPRFSVPDFSAEYRFGRDWGYVELAGMLRRIEWQDQQNTDIDLSGTATGWGLNLSSNLKFTKSTLGKFQVVYGEGIQNYMNDATTDIGIKNNFDDPKKPVIGVALPVLGIVSFIDQQWNEKWSSSVGYSLVKISNSDGQDANAFKQGHYALGNLLYSPVKQVMFGMELQYGKRQNYTDGWSSDIFKVQLSFKYSFSKIVI